MVLAAPGLGQKAGMYRPYQNSVSSPTTLSAADELCAQSFGEACFAAHAADKSRHAVAYDGIVRPCLIAVSVDKLACCRLHVIA